MFSLQYSLTVLSILLSVVLNITLRELRYWLPLGSISLCQKMLVDFYSEPFWFYVKPRFVTSIRRFIFYVFASNQWHSCFNLIIVTNILNTFAVKSFCDININLLFCNLQHAKYPVLNHKWVVCINANTGTLFSPFFRFLISLFFLLKIEYL